MLCSDCSALLFNEVKYVQTPAELQTIEKAVKGRADVVLAHVQALGTAGTSSLRVMHTQCLQQRDRN